MIVDKYLHNPLGSSYRHDGTSVSICNRSQHFILKTQWRFRAVLRHGSSVAHPLERVTIKTCEGALVALRKRWQQESGDHE